MAAPSARLLRLLSLLQARPHWSGPELAGRLGVTTRTLRRDIDRLRDLGYPVDAGPGVTGGYRLRPGGDVPPLLLDDDEATAVAVALHAAAAGAVPGTEQASLAALAKLDRLLPSRLRHRVDALRGAVVTLAPPGDAVDPDLLVSLAQACAAHERVALAYDDREGRRSERRIEPYRVVATGRRWYLLAFDVDRGDWRTFRVDRVAEARRTGHRFVPVKPPEPAEFVGQAITTRPYRHRATVVFDATADEVARRVPPTVGVVRARGRRAELTVGSDHVDSLVGHLVALDLPFEVVRPPELRERVRRLGNRLARAHRGSRARARG